MKTLLPAALAFATLASAAHAAPVRLVIDQPHTPITAVLAALSKTTGIPILADSTVTDTLGVATIDKPALEPMLDQLKTLDPGLQWVKVTVPAIAPLPTAEALSTQVRALQTLSPASLTVTNPVTGFVISYVRHDNNPVVEAPGPRQTVYLVTNEAIRFKREADAYAASHPKTVVKQAVAGLSNSADLLGQMSPDEQRQALPLMFQQFHQMMQNIDPGVMNEMRQNWQQLRQQGANGHPPGPNQ